MLYLAIIKSSLYKVKLYARWPDSRIPLSQEGRELWPESCDGRINSRGTYKIINVYYLRGGKFSGSLLFYLCELDIIHPLNWLSFATQFDMAITCTKL